MKLVYIDDLKSGMVVAQNIYGPEDTKAPLIVEGVVLSDFVIRRLRSWGVQFVFTRESTDTDLAVYRKVELPRPKPIISDTLRFAALDSLEQVFAATSYRPEDLHVNTVQVIKQLDTVVGQLVDALQNQNNLLVNINHLKSYDEYTFHHSLSVAVLAIAIGQHLGLSRGELHQMGMCAMMHDIGKIAIPIQIVNKTSRLDDREFSLIKTHSTAGYDYLIRSQLADEELLQGVLYHHERYDGTGYPKGIKGESIPLLSRIISVADVYDALTSNRPYRHPMEPAEAIEYIMGCVGTAFDHQTVHSFVRKVDLYPVGSFVQLSTGRIARVLENENQMRPIIQIMDTGEIVDLMRDRACYNIVITRLYPTQPAPSRRRTPSIIV